jgi:uncharacterized membrane protein
MMHDPLPRTSVPAVAPKRARGLARVLHIFYLSSLTIQAMIGTFQLLAAIALRQVLNDGWLARVLALTGHEPSEDAQDPIARFLWQALHGHALGGERFWSIYLFGHAVLNLGVVVALVADKPWARPASIAVLTGFIVYQLYRFALTGSWVMIALSLFDIAVIFLVWREHRAQ